MLFRSADVRGEDVAEPAEVHIPGINRRPRGIRGTDASESSRETPCFPSEAAVPRQPGTCCCMEANKSDAPGTWPTTENNLLLMRRRTGEELSAMVLEDPSATEVVLGDDGCVGSATKSPQRFKVAMRSKSAALSFPALRTSRCFDRRLFRWAAFAACIIFFVTSAKRFASSISSSMSILGRLPFFGRPPRFVPVTFSVGSSSATGSVAFTASAMPMWVRLDNSRLVSNAPTRRTGRSRSQNNSTYP